MKKISSSRTYFYKKVFPFVWSGFLLFILTIVFLSFVRSGQKPPYLALVPPAVLMIFGFALMKVLIFDLADEVYDGGDFLLIKFGEREEKVLLSNIKHLNIMPTNPRRITLTLRQPGQFGAKVSFSPITPVTLNPMAPNPIAEDLIERIDQSRK